MYPLRSELRPFMGGDSPPNGRELSRSADAGKATFILGPIAGQFTMRNGSARRVGSSELFGGEVA